MIVPVPDYERCLNSWITSLNKPDLPAGMQIEVRTGSGKIFSRAYPSHTLTPGDWKRFDIYEYRIFKI
jgi:hypothetical protein